MMTREECTELAEYNFLTGDLTVRFTTLYGGVGHKTMLQWLDEALTTDFHGSYKVDVGAFKGVYPLNYREVGHQAIWELSADHKPDTATVKNILA